MRHRLTLYPLGKTIELEAGTSLLEGIKQAGIYIKSSCGGHASCADCVLKVREGAQSFNEIGASERSLLGNVFSITKERLACQSFLRGDATVDLSAHNKATDEKKREQKSKSFRLRKAATQTLPAQVEEEAPEKPPRQGGKKRPKTFKS